MIKINFWKPQQPRVNNHTYPQLDWEMAGLIFMLGFWIGALIITVGLL